MQAISAESLAEFGGFVERTLGLSFPASRNEDLRRALAAAARDAGVADASRFLAGLLSRPVSRTQIEKLAGHVTIGETYFFRDPATFECVERHAVPELLRSRAASRRIRLWSAGCSSGEEPYSLAMTLSRSLALHGGWQASVLATDVNSAALRRGRAGVYDDWSFRAMPEAMKRQFFRPRPDGRFEVQSAIKGMVEFACLNLAKDSFPSPENGTHAMDIIFCRNVLMYFEPRHALAVLRKLERALSPGGWLFLSPVEIPPQIPEGLVRMHLPGVIALRKTADLHEAPAGGQRPAKASRASAAGHAGHGHESASRARPRRDGRERRAPATVDKYRQAQREYDHGDYARALATLEAMTASEPIHAEALALLARIRANRGELDEALSLCERAIEADKLCAAWPYLHATLLLAEDRVTDAVSSLRRALFLDPRHALAHFMLGNIARGRGATAEAARHLRNALALASERPPQHLVDAAEGITAGHLARLIESMLPAGERG